MKPIRDHLKNLALALAAAAGLGAGGAQALTTTRVINLGPPPGTAFTRGGGLYTQIPTGTLPPGSILRAVSWDVSLWQGDPYLGDLTVYIADSDGTNPVLQVGSVGANVDGAAPYTAAIQLPWNAGGNYNHGATASTTLTAAEGVPAVDLNTKTVFLENCYGNGGWAGTITLAYDVVALNVAVTTPANPYGYVTGTDISATAAVANGTPPYTVIFYTNRGAGNTVFAQAGQVTASSPPYQLDLGTLPDGVHNIYATVTDSNGGNASSAVNTFYTGVVFSAAASWTNSVSSTWWDYPNWDASSGYPVSSDATVINFTGAGTYTSTHNMGDGFRLNQVNFNNPVLTLAGNSLVFTTNGVTLPQINQNSANAVTLNTPLNLTAMTRLGGSGGGAVTISSLISGSGGLTKDSAGTLTINNINNTYSGGTVLNSGKVTFQAADSVTPFFGSGPVTVNPNATLEVNRTNLTNPITLNATTVTGGNSFGSYLGGPVNLTGITTFDFGTTGGFTIAGNISGTGGLTTVGTTQWSLSGTNSYTGPTTIQAGALSYDTAAAVGPGALNISSGGAKVRLNYTGTAAIASLTLGGVAQTVFGTYGSSLSGAAVQNDTYFAGSGTVTVSPIITSFGIPGYAGVIDQVAKTITLTVPFGTSLATLAPTFAVTFGSCNQTSGAAPSPTFAAGNPAHYIVTTGSFHNDYAVTVTVAPASTACDILSFGLPGNVGFIDPIAKTIVLTEPMSPGVSSLAPTYTVSQFATCSPSSGTTLNFTNPQTYTVTAQDGITQKSYSVTVQTYQAWTHSASLFILTTPEGANIPAGASESNFPLLVRLNKDSFDFSQAKAGGDDLRFSDAGQPLAYEMEEWNAAAGTAAIWVRIPAIHGNARQEIQMYWGNADAARGSNGLAVFNSTNGYSCVMHLNGNVLDSTGSTSPVNGGASPTTAVIGSTALNLVSGDITATNITNFPSGDSPASSGEVWIRARQINSWSMPLAWGNQNAYGWNTWGMQIGFWGSPTVLPAPLSCRGPAMVSGATALAAQQWYHVVYTNSNGTGKLYINGVLDATASGGSISITNPQAMSLGVNGGDADVDEARISSVVRSADWVKLEYENQKPLQTLLGNVVQTGSTFSATPPSVTMNEGATTTLSGQAGGAQKVYWSLVQNGVETVLATDQFTYTLSAGRVTGNQSFVIRFKGIYPTGNQTVDIPVTVTDTIPDPQFTLSAPTSLWDGRQTMTVTPVLSNLAALQTAGVANLNYHWSVAGVAVAKTITAATPTVPGVLTLTRAQGSGAMTVTLVLDNGGALVSSSKAITVQEPASDAWVQRTPGASEKAVSNQFYARDPNTNMGTIYYNGTGAGATPVYLKVFATPDAGTEAQYGQTLRQTPAAGAYGFSVPIGAGKVIYRVEFGTTTAGIDTPSATVSNLVCGDAYILEGQSNALAIDSLPADSTNSTWIRTYGRSTAAWGNAVRNGSDFLIGYWGYDLADYLQANRNLPICIINGAVGGTRIDQHQANPADHTVEGTSYSIYATLLNRLIAANLTHGIRGVFWHQGESDSGADSPTGDWDYKSYQQYFVDMSDAWKQDYPNVQRYIIYQVMPAPCSMGPKGDQLREVQRTLPSLYSKMHILNTLGVSGYIGCHFSAAGYQGIADRTAPLVNQDFYGIVPAMAVTAPILRRAYFTTTARTEIALEFDQDMSWNSYSLQNYYLDKVGNKVASGNVDAVNKKLVKLQLSAPGTTTSTLDYLEDAYWNYTESVSSLLYGANAIPALSFADVPVATTAPSPYGDWAANPAQGLTGGVNAGLMDDPDHDGIPNLLEFALGGNPSVASRTILPALTHAAGAWAFEYDRSDLSLPPATTQVVEYGSDLSGWTAVTIAATSSGSVTITPGSPFDHVRVAIPTPGARTFARLKVTQP